MVSFGFGPLFFFFSGSQSQPPALALSCRVGATSPGSPGSLAQKPLASPSRGVYPQGERSSSGLRWDSKELVHRLRRGWRERCGKAWKTQLVVDLCHAGTRNVRWAALRGFHSSAAQELCGRPFSISGTAGVSASCLLFVAARSRADTHPTLSCLISRCRGGRRAAAAATLIASRQPWTSAKYSPILEPAQLQQLKKKKKKKQNANRK